MKNQVRYRGMAMRDFFAGCALDEIIRSGGGISPKYCAEILGIDIKDYKSQEHFYLFCAKESYKVADAMIKMREEKS